MFAVNDYIVYGNKGVCRVEDITTLNFDEIDQDKKYYVLQPLYTKSSKIYIPVDSKKVIMRDVISKEEANELIEDIPNIDLLWVDNEKQREEIYKDCMQKCECREWVRIIKTLYLRNKERQAEGKKLSVVDEKYMQAAEDLLYGELAIALGIEKENVESFITERVNALGADLVNVNSGYN